MISLVLADDHDLIREGIKAILHPHRDYQVVGEAADGEEVVTQVTRAKPDILLLDISLPKRSGLDLIEQVRRLSPTTKIIIISVHRAPLYLAKALKAGALGYLHKENTTEDLLPALRRVAAGHTYVSAAVSESLTRQVAAMGPQPPEPPTLTTRETDVTRLVVEGKTAKEIAHALFISPRTVENHKQVILKKLGLRKTSDLIIYAMTHHLIEQTDS